MWVLGCEVGVWGILGAGLAVCFLGTWCDGGVVYPIISLDNFLEKVCVRGTISLTSCWDKVYPNNSFDKLLGEGEKSIREFFTKIHRTPWDTSIIYIPIIPLFEVFSTFWNVILDEKRRR